MLDSIRFGAITDLSCEFYLDNLKTRDEASLPDEANVLYELYLESDSGVLIGVPVLIRNYMLSDTDNDKGGGIEPNKGSKTEGDDWNPDWKMVRRFIILDTMSGVNPIKSDEAPIVTWASQL